MPQSDALTAETTAMRQFDLALQKVGDLPERAQVRVLTFVTDLIAERTAGIRDQALSVAQADARDAAREARERLDHEELQDAVAGQSS